MKSMTGYGKGEIAEGGRTLAVELKSVNHRFLDLSIKQPKQFNFAEDSVRKTLQGAFSRGHIDVYITYEDKSSSKHQLALDKALAESYLQMARRLAVELGVPNDLTASALMKFGDVISEDKAEADEATLMALLNNALCAAVTALADMREREGELIKSDFDLRLSYIKALSAKVGERAPEVVAAYRDKLSERIKELLGDVALDEARLINEVAFFTDKANIDEEITRLSAHIKQFEGLIESVDPVGRKLDFLLQEMNREVNTMGSKANDTQLLSIVVELKTELEKMREQIQNIE